MEKVQAVRVAQNVRITRIRERVCTRPGGKSIIPLQTNALFVLRHKKDFREFEWPRFLTLANVYKARKIHKREITLDMLKDLYGVQTCYAKIKVVPQCEVTARMDIPSIEELGIVPGTPLDGAHMVLVGAMKVEEYKTSFPDADLRQMLRVLKHRMEEESTRIEAQGFFSVLSKCASGQRCSAAGEIIDSMFTESFAALKKDAGLLLDRIAGSTIGKFITRVTGFARELALSLIAWAEGARKTFVLHLLALLDFIKGVLSSPKELIEGVMKMFGASEATVEKPAEPVPEGKLVERAEVVVAAQGAKEIWTSIKGVWEWIIESARGIAAFDPRGAMDALKDFNVVTTSVKNVQFMLSLIGDFWKKCVDMIMSSFGYSPYYETKVLTELERVKTLTEQLAAFKRAYEQSDAGWLALYEPLEKGCTDFLKHGKDPVYADACMTVRDIRRSAHRLYVDNLDKHISGSRAEPLCIIFRGDPGTKKSTAMVILAGVLAEHYGEKDAAIWNMSEDFQEQFGLNGAKSIVTIDDLFASANKDERAAEGNTLIHMVSTAPFMVPMAFEAKGAKAFEAIGIFGTANLDNWRQCGLTSPAALARRVILVDVLTLDSAYDEKGNFHVGKVNDTWTFTVVPRTALGGGIDLGIPDYHPTYSRSPLRNKAHAYSASEFINLFINMADISRGFFTENKAAVKDLAESAVRLRQARAKQSESGEERPLNPRSAPYIPPQVTIHEVDTDDESSDLTADEINFDKKYKESTDGPLLPKVRVPMGKRVREVTEFEEYYELYKWEEDILKSDFPREQKELIYEAMKQNPEPRLRAANTWRAHALWNEAYFPFLMQALKEPTYPMPLGLGVFETKDFERRLESETHWKLFVLNIQTNWKYWSKFLAVAAITITAQSKVEAWFKKAGAEIKNFVTPYTSEEQEFVDSVAKQDGVGAVSAGVKMMEKKKLTEVEERISGLVGVSRRLQMRQWGCTIGMAILSIIGGSLLGWAIGMGINVLVAYLATPSATVEQQGYSSVELPFAKKVAARKAAQIMSQGFMSESRQEMVEKIHRNVVKISVETEGGALGCTGLGIDTATILTSAHTLVGKQSLLIKQRIGKELKEQEVLVRPEQYVVTRSKTADWAIITLRKSSLNAFASLLHLIPTHEERKTFYSNAAMLWVSKGKQNTLQSSDGVHARDGRIRDEGGAVLTETAYTTTAQTEAGHSGSPWVVLDDNVVKPILGVHTGNMAGSAYIQPICLEDVQEVSAVVSTQGLPIEWSLPDWTKVPDFLAKCNVVATIPKEYASPLDQKQKFRPSQISEGLVAEGIPVQNRPSGVTATAYYKPLEAWVERAAVVDQAPLLPPSMPIIEAVAAQVPVPTNMEIVAFATVETIARGSGIVKGVPLNKSVGYPINKMAPFYQVKKDWWGDGERPRSAIGKWMELVRLNKPRPPRFLAISPKGELLPVAEHPEFADLNDDQLKFMHAFRVAEKVYAFKRTRGFTADPVDWMAITASIFWVFAHAHNDNPLRTPFLGSFEKESAASVAGLVRSLYGYDLIDVDSKMFDLRWFQSQKELVETYVLYWHKTYFPYRSQEERVLHTRCIRAWFEDMWSTYVAIGRLVVEFKNFFTSGGWLTIVLQSIRQCLMSFTALVQASRLYIAPDMPVITVLQNSIGYFVGDDALLGLKALLSKMTPEQYQTTYENLWHVVTTCSDKDVHFLPAWKKIEDLFFLKSGLQLVDNQWRMPLTKVSIESQLHYHRSRGDEAELLKQQAESAIRAAMHWGPKYFEFLSVALRRSFARRQFTCVLPSYDQVVREYTLR